jgi:hypothetical protein
MKEFNLTIPKMGYFIVYKRRKGFHPLEKLIANEQIKEGFSEEDSQYVHVEISGGSNHSINASFPVVRHIKMNEKHKGRYCKIVAYNHRDFMTTRRFKVAYHAATMCNKPYGILSLLWFKVNNLVFKKNNVLASRHMPYCSFLCSWALKKVFINSFENPGNIMPSDFVNKEKFTVIWEGIIK